MTDLDEIRERLGSILEAIDDMGARLSRLEAEVAKFAADLRTWALARERGPAADNMAQLDLASLTERQSQILWRLLRGQRPPSIAKDLYLSPATVRNHLSAIYKKLKVKSQSELVEMLHLSAWQRPGQGGSRSPAASREFARNAYWTPTPGDRR